MNRYFFDLRDQHGIVPDEEGLFLASLDAVQEEAARTLGDIAREPMNALQVRQLSIEVRDDHGPVLCAKFSFEVKRLQ
jgi:hypothetical protein